MSDLNTTIASEETEFSWMEDDELLVYAALHKHESALVRELASRFETLLHMHDRLHDRLEALDA